MTGTLAIRLVAPSSSPSPTSCATCGGAGTCTCRSSPSGLRLRRLFIDPTPRVPMLVNWTPSLPYHVALMQFQQQPVRRGDLIVFAFAGEAQAHYPGLRGQPFFKQVRGMPGDVVTVRPHGLHQRRGRGPGQDPCLRRPSAGAHRPGSDPAGPLLRAGRRPPQLRLALRRKRPGACRAGAGHRGADLLRSRAYAQRPHPRHGPTAGPRAGTGTALAQTSPAFGPLSAAPGPTPPATCRWPTTSACWQADRARCRRAVPHLPRCLATALRPACDHAELRQASVRG
jgi:hypothetical protein